MPAKTALSLNNLIQEIFALADGHVMLNSRFYGNFLEIYESNKVDYSTLLMNVNNATVDPSYYQLTVELMVMDKVFKGEENRTDVESDTITILGDVFSVISYSNRWQAFSKVFGATQMRKFIHKGEDEVTGWAMSVQLGLKRNNGICDLPMKNYDFEGEYTPSCAGVRIFEDDILIEVVESGGLFSYTTGADPANILLNGVAYGTIPAGGSKDITIKGTDDLDKGSKVDDDNLLIADSPIESSLGNFTDSVVSELTYIIADVPWTDSDGSPQTAEYGEDIICTPSVEVLNTSSIYKSGATVSYTTNDDGDSQFGRGVDFVTLDFNNGFDVNTNRFTDTLGGSTYANDVAIDWSTWDRQNDTVMAYLITPQSGVINTVMANEPYTFATKTDWRMINVQQLHDVSDDGFNSQQLDYPPFNIDDVNTGSLAIATKTRNNVSLIRAYGGAFNTFQKTSNSTARYMLFRVYPLSELGL